MINPTPTTKTEALTEAFQAVNRAGYVFINPPPRAMEICLEPLCKAIKSVKDLEKKPLDRSRLEKAVKALKRVAYKFEHLAQVRLDAGYIDESRELTSISQALHLVGIDLLRTFHPTK